MNVRSCEGVGYGVVSVVGGGHVCDILFVFRFGHVSIEVERKRRVRMSALVALLNRILLPTYRLRNV